MTETIRVLYVDPDRSAADGVITAFDAERPALTVTAVTSAEACLDALDETVDCVVSEYDLPETDGLALFRSIRDAVPALPFVLFTEHGAEGLARDALAEGIADYVRKQEGTEQYLVLANRIESAVRAAPARAAALAGEDVQREFAESASDVLITIDESSTIQFVNGAVEDVLGYAPDELIGRPLTTIMTEPLGRQHAAGMQRYLETGERTLDWSSLELPGLHKDGHEVPLGVSFGEYSHGDRRFFTGVLRDITERKRRERRLEQYETMVETVGDGIYALNSESEFIAVNDTFTSLIGYSREELLGSHASLVHGEGDDGMLAVLRAVMDGERERATVETELRTATGDAVPIEVRLARYPLGDGRYGRIGVVRDISERRAREREHQRILRAMQTADEGISLLDENREFVYVNDAYAALFGYEPEEMIGERWEDIGIDADPEYVETEILPPVEETGQWTGETTCTRKDGGTFAAQHALARAAGGELVCIISDVTERNRMEAALREERNVKERLAETSPIGITIVDEEGRFSFVNNRAEEILGVTADELAELGYDATRFETVDADGDPIPPAELPFRRVIETGTTVYGVEIGITRPGGERVWLSMNGAPLHADEDGATDAVFTFKDVTERVQLETELNEVLGRVTDAFFALDTEWQFTYVNDRAEELLQRPAEQILGRDVWEEFSAGADRAFRREYERAMESQEAVAFEEYYPPPLDTWFGVRAYPSETGLSVYFRDITDRKRLEDDLRRERDLKDRIMETSPTGIAVIDTEANVTFMNERAERVVGRTREELNELPYNSEMLKLGDGDGDPIPDAETPFRRVLDTGEPIFDADYTLTRPDGERVWLSMNGAPLYDQDGELESVVLTFDDITDRKRHESQLATLNELSQDLMNAETPTEVSASAIEAARTVLDLSVATIALYDEESGRLRPVARTAEAAETDDQALLFEHGADLAWRVFVGNEAAVYDDLAAEADIDESETPFRSGVIIPLGRHGVFVTGSTEADEFGEPDLDLIRILAANTQAALYRADREQMLHEREEALAGQNEQLERLNRINEVIRGIDQALVEAASREEIEQEVCDRLVTAEPYHFAWMGVYDAVSRAVTPRAWAGAEDGYLDAVTITADSDDPTGNGPTGTAVRTREPQVMQNMMGDPPFEPWRQEALNRGYRSSIAVPVAYEETLYGVLNVYANEPNIFDETEQAVLTELGETIGHAINAVETKRTLLTDRIVQLELSIRNADSFLPRLAREAGCEVTFEGLIPQSNGTFRVFFTASDATPDEILGLKDRVRRITELQLISERQDEATFEATVADETIVSTIADCGAVTQSLDADGDAARVIVELPQTADVRSFIDALQTSYPETELLARRDHDRPIETSREFRSEFERQLTDKQRTALHTAYLSGYFEWPRESTGEEIAELLDVSRPTFNRHARAGERKLFEMLFGER